MTSTARRSEEALATLACAQLAEHASPRLLIAGLGMGYTLRAALDALPAAAHVEVAELQPEVVDWCRGPMAQLSRAALDDARVEVRIADVAAVIAEATGRYDAIVLDLYEGPYATRSGRLDPLFGPVALRQTRTALATGGILAVWAEDFEPAFPRRLEAAGFAAQFRRVGGGGRKHVVYLGR